MITTQVNLSMKLNIKLNKLFIEFKYKTKCRIIILILQIKYINKLPDIIIEIICVRIEKIINLNK